MNIESISKFSNHTKSIAILKELGEQGLTMYSGFGLNHVAEKFRTTNDCVRQNATRHDGILQIIKRKDDEIRKLKSELQSFRTAASQGIVANTDRQPWEMTTDEFKAHLKATWVDPAANDDCIGFGLGNDHTPLCELPNK